MPQEQWEIAWKDYYAVLQVQPTAEAIVIKAMARSLAQRYHPDKPGGDVKRMALINEAGEYLGDEQKKAAYDIEWRKRQGKSEPQQEKSEPQRKHSIPPNLSVYPKSITITRKIDVVSYVAQFTVRNSGGPYETFEIVTPEHRLHPNQEVNHWLSVPRIEFQGLSGTLPAVVSCPINVASWEPHKAYKAMVFVVLTDADDETYAERVDVVVSQVQAPTRNCPRCGKWNPASFKQCWVCQESLDEGPAPGTFGDKFCKRCGRPFRAQEKWCPKDRYQRR